MHIDHEFYSCDVTDPNTDDLITLTITFKSGVNPDASQMEYIAAAPVERRASYTGSGLPFSSAQMAFDNTPNKGSIQMNTYTHEIVVKSPNSYYSGHGTVLIPPTVYFSFIQNGKHRKVSVKLNDGVYYRTLTYPSQRTGAMFYDNVQNLPVRSQEQVLRDSAYPQDLSTVKTFWNLKPSL